MDPDQQQKDIFSSFFPEQQQQQQYSGTIPIPASPVYNGFAPSSPQSANSQLAMSMLLMQMQGLGDVNNSTLPPHQQQQGIYQPPNQQNAQQLVLEHQFKLSQLQQLQQLQNTILQHQVRPHFLFYLLTKAVTSFSSHIMDYPSWTSFARRELTFLTTWTNHTFAVCVNQWSITTFITHVAVGRRCRKSAAAATTTIVLLWITHTWYLPLPFLSRIGL